MQKDLARGEKCMVVLAKARCFAFLSQAWAMAAAQSWKATSTTFGVLQRTKEEEDAVDVRKGHVAWERTIGRSMRGSLA